jgi:hypothetical protein
VSWHDCVIRVYLTEEVLKRIEAGYGPERVKASGKFPGIRFKGKKVEGIAGSCGDFSAHCALRREAKMRDNPTHV